ncbi:MAG: 30S ribosome-binding factor RbfA [Hyphomicrobiales bacterium]|nr:MAG: 30S ribosome-binding factor RbfA [Hyphomicrobiales bacterium]
MGRFGSRGKGPSKRQLRVGEMVRHALTLLLQRGEIRDPLLETTVISISEVAMSPDLRIATAYISPLGVKDGQPVIKALASHAKFIRGRLARSLSQMKHQPDIRFQIDTSFDNYATIDQILQSPKVQRDLEASDDIDTDGEGEA